MRFTHLTSWRGAPASVMALTGLSICAALAPVCWLAGAQGSDAAAPAPLIVPRIVFEKYRLANGLEVILSPKRGLPVVTIDLWYHVGAISERAGRSGFAHLFEHMMFQGSAHVAPGAHLEMLERAGATHLNASTDFDYTNYFETVPTNYLSRTLWLESDRMGFLLDALHEDKLRRQIDVVQNERRQRVTGTPYGIAEEQAWHALFPEPHPYHGDVIGSMRDLDAASLADVREFFQTHYSPANATLCVVGDYDPLFVQDQIADYFGTLPYRAAPEASKPAQVAIRQPIELSRELEAGKLPMLWLGWLSPRALTPGDAAADLLAGVLAGSQASRLYRRLVQERGIAQSVTAAQQSLGAQSVFSIQAIGREGVDPRELREAVDGVLSELNDDAALERELARARAVTSTRIIASLQTTAGTAERLQLYNAFVGDPGYLPKDLVRYAAVSGKDAAAFAHDVLAFDRRAVMYAAPASAVGGK